MVIPNKKGVEILIKKIFKLFFPLDGTPLESDKIEPGRIVIEQLDNIFRKLTTDKESNIKEFIGMLPPIRKILIDDAKFILQSDPAARSLEEVIAIYPGFFAIYCYRIAHSLHLASIPLLPRMITEYAHKITGIDIHPGALIGSPFSIDHGTGIVIGETAIIGCYVKLFQGVTLGALSVDKGNASIKRHPTIEDNVVLYAGSTILGGSTIVGKNSIIGGNVWLTESVAPFSIVYHKSQIVIRDQNLPPDVINFNI